MLQKLLYFYLCIRLCLSAIGWSAELLTGNDSLAFGQGKVSVCWPFNKLLWPVVKELRLKLGLLLAGGSSSTKSTKMKTVGI